MQNIHSKNRVAKNTILLYIRTLLVTLISIYTSRVVLDALGVEDFGIYNVVGGFVSMFSVLSGTLTAASQRYIAFELGKERPNVKTIFSTTISIHLVMAILMLVVLESFGLWFINYKMNISDSRINAANWVFHCSVATFCCNIISIPYNAAIIAHEKMSAFAYISIFEVLLKLCAVFLLYTVDQDHLICYAVFMLLIAIFLRLLSGGYCTWKFPACKYSFILNKDIFKEMLSFCGWNFIGSTAKVLTWQGTSILINLFFGVTLNAARGIAAQVEHAVNSFVQNFTMALNPQITKSYAAQDYIYVNKMIISGTKFCFYLFWIISFPIFINTDYILSLWLKEIPLGASLFIQLGLIYNLSQNLSQCLYTTMLATGKIKKYQIIIGGISILSFPTTYLLYHFDFPSEWGYISIIFYSIVCLFFRLYLLQGMVPLFNGITYLKKVILPIIGATIIPILLSIIVHKQFAQKGFISFLLESIFYIVICCINIWIIGLSNHEKKQILEIVYSKIKHKSKAKQ